MIGRRLLVGWCVACVALSAIACAREKREPLRELYTPTFSSVPPSVDAGTAIESLRADWRGGGRETFLSDVRSLQGLTLATALVVILVAGWPARRSESTLGDLLLLFAAGVPLFGVMRFFDHLRDPAYLWLLDAVFASVMALGLAVAVRATVLAVRHGSAPLEPRARGTVLGVLLAVLLAGNIALALQRPPDDAGWFVNLGGQRLRERGLLPYGDPLLTGTPAAAYGPLMYVAHVPFQVALTPQSPNPAAPDNPELGEGSRYYLPPMRATQLCAVTFHLAGGLALFVFVRRRTSLRTALATAALYCGSLAVLGVGGQEYSVAGITFISHIAPASMTLVALALLHRPVAAGIALVAAAGLGFYPALFGPIWLGYYWRDRQARIRFALGCAVTAAALLAFVLSASRGTEEHSRVQTILADTLGHHTDPSGYGRSPFGFWGQRPGWRDWAMRPVVGGNSLTSPVWLALLAYVGFASMLATRRGPAALALLSAVVALGFALVKPHATGTYLAWYYPLMLAGLALPRFTSEPQKV